jgi:hypothetical protein
MLLEFVSTGHEARTHRQAHQCEKVPPLRAGKLANGLGKFSFRQSASPRSIAYQSRFPFSANFDCLRARGTLHQPSGEAEVK